MQQSEYHEKIKKHLHSAYLLSDDKIENVLPRFIASLQTLMDNLERVFQTEEGDSLSKAGHALKGALLNLGLNELAEKAFTIEKQGHDLGEKTEIAALISELRKEVNSIE